MSIRPKSSGGSRFLYDSFDAAAARIEANERVAEERWAALEWRLGQIDAVLERLEKRIWLGVYGVAAFLLAQMAEALAAQGLAENAAVEVTPEVLAAAIATSVNSSMAKVYAMRQGDSLDLTALLSQVQAEGAAAALGALDNPAPVLHLTMADVLSLPAQNGVHQLVLSGTVNDKLMLSKDEWTDTGAVVNQDGHTYAVYAGSTDASAQLLIDQHQALTDQFAGLTAGQTGTITNKLI